MSFRTPTCGAQDRHSGSRSSARVALVWIGVGRATNGSLPRSRSLFATDGAFRFDGPLGDVLNVAPSECWMGVASSCNCLCNRCTPRATSWWIDACLLHEA